jgi:hypothetical protein
MRRALRARSYEGIEHPAKPSAAFAGSCENAELIPMLRGVGGLDGERGKDSCCEILGLELPDRGRLEPRAR